MLTTIILACQIFNSSCDFKAMRESEYKCRKILTECFEMLRPVHENDDDAMERCLYLTRDINF